MSSTTLPTTNSTKPQLRFWQRLQWNLILYFVLLAIIPLAVVVYITLSQVSGQATRQVFGALESVSGVKASQIQQWLASAQEITTTILNTDTRQSLIDVLNNPTEEKSTAVSQKLKALVDDTNNNAKDTIDIFDKYFIYTLDGRVVAASDPSDLGKSTQRQPYFENSLAKAYTQSPYYAVGTGQLTMNHTEPILDKGKIVGILAGQLNVKTLSEIMTERVGMGDTGET